MKPERIEEIKTAHEYMTKRLLSYPSSAQTRMNDDIADLLAALEESQQAIAALHEYNHRYAKERDEAKRELEEAQQTIARQREVLEFLADDDNWSWCWVGTEDETVTWVGGTDPQQEAREALGNKEGSDKA